MMFSNCDLFMRSFTSKGIGFTFNNEMSKYLYKNSLNLGTLLDIYEINGKKKVSKMFSAGSDHGLEVLIENNIEEVKRYENTKSTGCPKISGTPCIKNEVGITKLKPNNIEMTLHNPKEPANIRIKSFKIPLGHSTIVYITPKAREIDDSGKELSEVQRGCRLTKDTQELDIFNIYTQEACLLECMIKQAHQRCGCFPWNYLTTEKVL